MTLLRIYFSFFFFNDTATTEIYTLSLHDALPIYALADCAYEGKFKDSIANWLRMGSLSTLLLLSPSDRKSTRLNSSHGYISYAVFCLKKKKKTHRYSKSV